MHGDTQGLDERQVTAAKMLARGKRPSDVADELGVVRYTVSRWKRNPEFRKVIQEERDELFDELLGSLIEGSPEGMARVRETIKDENSSPTLRFSASKFIVTMALQAYECIRMEERIAALEALRDGGVSGEPKGGN